MNSRDTGGKSGFTLIELLVSVGITAMLVALMLTIVVNVMGGWSRSSGSLTSGNQARLVLDQLTRDLQAAIVKNDGNVWLAATIQPTGPIGNWGSKPEAESLSIPTLTTATNPVPALDDYRFGQAGVWLRFFSTVPDTNAAGDLTHLSAPRAVSYQIVREPVTAGGSENRYLLFRSEVSPVDTFTNGYNLYDNAKYEAVGTALRSPALSQVLANNIVDFGVRFWKRDSSTGDLVPLFPTSSATLAFAATTGTSGDGTKEATPIRDFPEVVDIFLRVLTDDGVQKLDLLDNPPAGYVSTDTWWDIVLANSNVYTRRIEIKSKAF